MNNKEQYVKVSDILNCCRQSAKANRELANKCIESVGKGESETSSLGGAAYFLQQARMYEFDIPNMIQTLNFAEVDSILETPLEALGLSTRSYNSLSRANIKRLGDITKLYVFELKAIRNLGGKAYEEVIDTVRKYGVGLKGETE
jgi:DNA-directed RNA polymerase alpha subunit